MVEWILLCVAYVNKVARKQKTLIIRQTKSNIEIVSIAVSDE